MISEHGGLLSVEKLDATHDNDSFDCGKEPLNRFLKRFALASQKAESAGLMSSAENWRYLVTIASRRERWNRPPRLSGSAKGWPSMRCRCCFSPVSRSTEPVKGAAWGPSAGGCSRIRLVRPFRKTSAAASGRIRRAADAAWRVRVGTRGAPKISR